MWNQYLRRMLSLREAAPADLEVTATEELCVAIYYICSHNRDLLYVFTCGCSVFTMLRRVLLNKLPCLCWRYLFSHSARSFHKLSERDICIALWPFLLLNLQIFLKSKKQTLFPLKNKTKPNPTNKHEKKLHIFEEDFR